MREDARAPSRCLLADTHRPQELYPWCNDTPCSAHTTPCASADLRVLGGFLVTARRHLRKDGKGYALDRPGDSSLFHILWPRDILLDRIQGHDYSISGRLLLART